MKYVYIFSGILIALALIFQGWVYYASNVEEQPYEVMHAFGDVEIRHYPAARMASVDQENSEDLQRSGFSMLAGYIFGGNEEEQKFAMTAPVHMSRSEEGARMSFVLPQDAWEKELPAPNDERVNLHWSEPSDVAAIQFSGYANQEKIERYKKEMLATLDSLHIAHQDNFSLLGYDPPFKTTGRRNELLVGIDTSTLPK